MTALATTPRPLSRTGRWLTLSGWLTTGYWVVLGGFLVVAMLVAAVVLALVSRTTTPTLSAMQFAQQATWWLPFGISIYYATAWLGPAVAAGMPRRDFTRSAVGAALLLAASAAVVLVLILAGEQWLYERLGWTAGTDQGRVMLADTATVAYTWGAFVLLAAGGLSGLVVGLTYLRWGPRATLLLPVTVSPMALVGWLAIDPYRMFAPLFVRVDGQVLIPADLGLGALALAGVGIAILVLTALAVHLLARRTPIPAPRA